MRIHLRANRQHKGLTRTASKKRNFAALVLFGCQHASGKTICRFGKGEATMLYWALVFLIVALVAAALGFGGIAGASAGIAKILFFIFLVCFWSPWSPTSREDPAYPDEDFRMARKY